jgi:acylphosphatase
LAIAVRIRIRGIVHGVSFRASMAGKAAELGVRGWVRNLPDGTVEAFLEGEEGNVRRLTDWARTGPPRARVDRVDVERAVPRFHRDFRVRG